MRYKNEYDEFLDDLYNTGNWNFSKLLKDSDPIAYEVGYDDFLCSRDLDEDDEANRKETNE